MCVRDGPCSLEVGACEPAQRDHTSVPQGGSWFVLPTPFLLRTSIEHRLCARHRSGAWACVALPRGACVQREVLPFSTEAKAPLVWAPRRGHLFFNERLLCYN